MDCHRTYESILFGAVPIVLDYSGALTRDVFKMAPTYVIGKQDWWKRKKGVTKEELLSFEVDNRWGRRVVMAQYWFDKFERIREKYRKV